MVKQATITRPRVLRFTALAIRLFSESFPSLRSPSDFRRPEAIFDSRRLRFVVADIRKRSVIENGRSSISNREKDTE
jgi:hypothetical protein